MEITDFLRFIENSGLQDSMFYIEAHNTSIGRILVHSIKSIQETFILKFIEVYRQNFDVKLKYIKYFEAPNKFYFEITSFSESK